MRKHAILAAILFLALTRPVASAELALPVARGSDAAASGPHFRADAIELRLAPRAARIAHPQSAGPTQMLRSARLGVEAVDLVAASLRVQAFEPIFRGEVAPFDDASVDFTAFHRVLLPEGADVADALARFRALPDVLSADPIAVLPTSSLPNDSLAAQTVWLFRDVTPRHDIRAPEGWLVERGDTNIVVGILDTGVNGWHPDLGGRGERGQMFVNWAEQAGLPGVDDDGNGYVDDVSGWDFVAIAPNGQGGEDIGVEDNDPSDWVGHGTFVAGIIGAISGNGIGLSGVAPEVRLMPLRIGWLPNGATPPNGQVDMSYAAAAIRYATRMGVQVLNCSFTSLNQGSLDAAVTVAARAGVTLVVASGNFSGAAAYLGQREETIAVAATDSNDVIWPNAQRGPWVDLVADGVGLVSTYFQRTGVDSLGGRTPAYRANLSGTSFSAPQVAGAVALLQAQRRHLALPPLTPLGVRLRVRETAEDIRALNPSFTQYGSGRLDLSTLLKDDERSWVVRGGAQAAGAPVVINDNRGITRIVQATTSSVAARRRLVWLDPVSQDTAFAVPLPANPTGQLAAGELLDGQGPVVAQALINGQLMAWTAGGAALPGFPVALGGGVLVQSGVVIADIDGDGRREFLVGTSNGRIHCVRGDGSLPNGFPIETGASGIPALAVAELDAVPGAEIVALDGDNSVHVFSAGGLEAAGWPIGFSGSVRAPVIQRLQGVPQIVVVSICGLYVTGITIIGRMGLAAAIVHMNDDERRRCVDLLFFV